jgi:hypothetical protein
MKVTIKKSRKGHVSMTIRGLDGRAQHKPNCTVDKLGENCNCGLLAPPETKEK